MRERLETHEGATAMPHASAQEDAVLAKRILSRDPEALAELHDRYRSLAYAVVLRLVRDAWITEELTQEVFLRVWNCIERFDERRGELRQWIITIAKNKALDYLRSKDARTRRSECALNNLPCPAKQNSVEERIMTEELVRLSRNAMEKLTAKQRQAFRLTYFEGKTQSEIAAELKAPLGTVKTWVRAASKMVRTQLAVTPAKVCTCCSTYV